jgi:putative FmdB family regulatory protein
MPRYDYKCEDCGVVQEYVKGFSDPLPESLTCPRCKGDNCFHVWLVAPGVLTGGMDHKTIDVQIGKDAEARWQAIHDRKAERDKVRAASGKQHVTAVMDPGGKDEWRPSDKQLMSVEQGSFPKPQDKPKER